MNSKPAHIPFHRTGELKGRYRGIRDSIQDTSSDDINHQLPNLVDAVQDYSKRPNTVRFRIGISFTEDFTPLDYYLIRIVDDDGDRSIHEVKERASNRHMYLEFHYPPDLRFDERALRGAMLTAVDRELRSVTKRQKIEQTEVTGLWRQLSNFLE